MAPLGYQVETRDDTLSSNELFFCLEEYISIIFEIFLFETYILNSLFEKLILYFLNNNQEASLYFLVCGKQLYQFMFTETLNRS